MTTRTAQRVAGVAAATLALTLSLSACGGDDEPPGDNADRTPSATTTPGAEESNDTAGADGVYVNVEGEDALLVVEGSKLTFLDIDPRCDELSTLVSDAQTDLDRLYEIHEDEKTSDLPLVVVDGIGTLSEPPTTVVWTDLEGKTPQTRDITIEPGEIRAQSDLFIDDEWATFVPVDSDSGKTFIAATNAENMAKSTRCG